MKWSISLQIGIVTLITFVFLGFLGHAFYANEIDQVDAAQWLIHSHEVLRSVESVFSKVKDVEIAEHDYNLTGSKQLATSCLSALSAVQTEINHLAALTTDSSREQTRVPWLDKLVVEWQDDINLKIARRSPPANMQTISTGTNSSIGGKMRDILSEIRQQEYTLLGERNESFRTNNSTDIRNVTILIGMPFVLLSISFIFVLYYERDRKQSSMRSQVQYNVTRILSQADSLDEAAEHIISSICNGLGFNCGLLWWNDAAKGIYNLDQSTTQRMSKGWTNAKLDSNCLAQIIRQPDIERPLNSGRLPIIVDGSLLWVNGDQCSPYLHGGTNMPAELSQLIVVPIKAEDSILGALELFGLKIDRMQPAIVQLLDGLSSQIAQFIEKKKTDRRLKEREEIFQQLADNIREVFWVTSPDGQKCYYVSPAYEQLLGFSRARLYENPLDFIQSVAPEDKLRVKEFFTRQDLPPDGAAIEYRVLTPDQEEHWIWSNTFPVKNQSGAMIRKCGISHDITERKEMERRVSEFYSMVSHELRTPLTSIRAALGLLEGGLAGNLSEKAGQLVTIARNESDRLIRLINDILDIRKIAAGKLELKKEIVDPSQVVQTTIKSLEAMATDVQVRLSSEIKTGHTLSGDKDRIVQVLTNLVSNAIKFSPAGGQIKIVLEGHEQMIRFSVADQGPGIPSDKLDRLFRPFQQLDSSDTRAKGGTGLGLTISKAIVEEHGGKIGVDTTPGTGATFWFELPTLNQKVISLPGAIDVSGMHQVLIVEDDLQLAELLKLRLQEDGYNLLIAPTLKIASDALANKKIEVIILDIQLPDGNGLDWLKKAEESGEAKTLPVIVITGRELDMNTYSLPMLIGWLRKPFEEKELLKALELAVKEKGSRAPKVLIVEDDRNTRKLIIDQLQHLNVVFIEAPDGASAITMAIKENPDLIILDISLPYNDGFTVVEVLRHEKVANTPLLVYTSRDLDKQDMQNLSLGLTRHLIKSRTSETQFLDTVRELLLDVTKSTNKLKETSALSQNFHP